MIDTDRIPSPPIGALSINAFCRVYSIGRTAAYAAIQSGRLQAQKSGRRTIIPVASAEAWLASLPALGAAR